VINSLAIFFICFIKNIIDMLITNSEISTVLLVGCVLGANKLGIKLDCILLGCMLDCILSSVLGGMLSCIMMVGSEVGACTNKVNFFKYVNMIYYYFLVFLTALYLFTAL
jgi:hypothetical protein